MKSFFDLILAAVLALTLALASALPALAQPGAAPDPAGRAPEYRLGAGDIIRVSVFQNPELSLELRVTEAGIVGYPLLGPIRLGGLSVTAAEKLIADGLRDGNFVKQPQVSIIVAQFKSSQASVLGQVNRPGRYALEVTDMRLTDLLALAGGVATQGADTVVVSGVRNGRLWRQEVDLPALFGPGGAKDDLAIGNGDTIWVSRQPMVYIYGEVQKPGAVRLERGMTVMQVLATGGGPTLRGTEKGIRVHRRDANGRVQQLQPAMDEPVRDGDVVFVRESLF